MYAITTTYMAGYMSSNKEAINMVVAQSRVFANCYIMNVDIILHLMLHRYYAVLGTKVEQSIRKFHKILYMCITKCAIYV